MVMQSHRVKHVAHWAGVVVTQDIEGSAPASDRPSIRRSETGSESQSATEGQLIDTSAI